MRFRGVSQIVVFYWPFYAFALAAADIAVSVNPLLPEALQYWVLLAVGLGGLSVALTLVASWYVYDLTNLYVFDYLDTTEADHAERIANIHAGFDETSVPLGQRICLGLAVFWTTRLFFQFFGYSSDLWKGKRFESIVHIVFSELWLYLSTVFWLAAVCRW
jgi:hypothetical protein